MLTVHPTAGGRRRPAARRLLCILLALALSLTACGGKDDGETGGYTAGGSEGHIGDTLYTFWFRFTVKDVQVCREFGGYTAGEGKQLVAAELSVENTCDFSIDMYRDDFVMLWGNGSQDFGFPLPAERIAKGKTLPDEYRLDAGDSREGLLVYEVPEAEAQDFALLFFELFDDGTEAGREGDFYTVYLTAGDAGDAK